MPLRVHVDVVSAEELIFSGETDFRGVSGRGRRIGYLSRATRRCLTRVKPGTVRLKIPDREEYELVYVSGGVLEVQPTLITLLADTAIRAHDLDEAKAIEAKRHAEEVAEEPRCRCQLRHRGGGVGAGHRAVESDQAGTQSALEVSRPLANASPATKAAHKLPFFVTN
jgi:F-type H+-transporting ATPase subunit epsilon